ncbi:MAG: hypothetical protein WDZ83_05325 [Rhizobiaceae bacterium]
MAEITGLQVTGFVDGASANNGQDVAFKLRVSDGKSEQDATFFLAHDQLPIFISHLITYGSLARNTRLGRNPQEEADGTYASGHALGLVDAYPGVSISEPGAAILTLQFDGGQGRKLNLHCAATADQIAKLQTACEKGLELLQTNNQSPPLQ